MTDIDVQIMKKALDDALMMRIGDQYVTQEQMAEYKRSAIFTEINISLATPLFNERIQRIKRGGDGEYLFDAHGNPVLEDLFNKTLKEIAEERSWRLLERELGTTDFQTFQKSGLVTLRASNGKDFSITRNGQVTIHTHSLMGRRTIEGHLFFDDNQYPVADTFWTLIKWIKADPQVVEDTIVQHCGQIILREGEPPNIRQDEVIASTSHDYFSSETEYQLNQVVNVNGRQIRICSRLPYVVDVQMPSGGTMARNLWRYEIQEVT